MDIVSIVGLIIAVVTITAYIMGVFRASPRLVLRLANAKHLHVLVRNPTGTWILAISTTRTSPVFLNECTVVHDCTNLMFASAGLFEPSPIGPKVGLTWKGNERLESGQFLALPLNYSCSCPVTAVLITVSLVCSVPPDAWRFPLSMFSPQPKRRNYNFRFTVSPDAEHEISIRVSPGEGVRVIGPAAKRPLKLSGTSLDVTATEINDDGTYKVHHIKQD